MMFKIKRFIGKLKFPNFGFNLGHFPKVFFFIFVVLLVLYLTAWLGYGSGFRNAKSERTSYSEDEKEDELSWEDLLRSDVDTNAWKTFVDDLYGYSIKYPENWHLLEQNIEIERALISDIPDPSPHYYKENENGRIYISRSWEECDHFLECVVKENFYLKDGYYLKFIRFGSRPTLFGFSDLNLNDGGPTDVTLFVDYQDYFLEFIGHVKAGHNYYENLKTVLGMLKSLEFAGQ